jgi:deoxyhypusine synthase
MSEAEAVAVIAAVGTTMEETIESNLNILEAMPLNPDNKVTSKPHIPSVSASAVLGESSSMPKDAEICKGHDFESVPKTHSELDAVMESFLTTGFQATNIGLAVEQIRLMRKWRLSDTLWKDGDDPALKPDVVREKIRARIFLAYTSNQISCGQREVIKFLIKNKMVDLVVTTAGGIEEDIIKCFQPTYMGDFKLSGRELRRKGINRIGNLLVPNKNYCEFEDWMSPIIEAMHDEQDAMAVEWAKQIANRHPSETDPLPAKFCWTPSKIIRRLGEEIDNPDSVLYWAAKHNIPVFCPALTDGSIGDMLYFHSYKRPGFLLDINEDIRVINDLAVRSHCTGQVILGGGLVKHHTCNANLMRNGADYSVYVNTGHEFDGSDSGASPDEAISWGKIRITAKPVKGKFVWRAFGLEADRCFKPFFHILVVLCDASIAFPLIVSQTFAKDVDRWREETKECVCWAEDLVHLS